MLCVIFIVVLSIFFLWIAGRTRGLTPQARTLKITKPLSRLLPVLPLVAAAVFAVLFATVLLGRLAERSAHALLVLALWLYGARFYQYLISYYKNRVIGIASAVGMAFSVGLAMLLTPLSRYADLIYSSLGWYAILLGGGALLVFYAAALLERLRAK